MCRLSLGSVANDWLHGNLMQLTPDGHLLYSARHQDWLIKIDYANGAGSGGVIWRLGPTGISVRSDDPLPWFSHQHDANYEPGVTSIRVARPRQRKCSMGPGPRHSIARAGLEIDEANRIVTLVLNADFGDYSRALVRRRSYRTEITISDSDGHRKI